MKRHKHIEIVRSSVSGLSSMGHKSCDMIEALLLRHFTSVGVSIVDNLQDLERVAARQPDLVFLGVKQVPINADAPDTMIWTSAFFEARGIAYTGSPASAIALDFSKPSAKHAIQSAGLATSAFFSASPGEYRQALDLPVGFPLFVKPPETGGGKGINADSVVRDFAGFTRKVAAIAEEFRVDALAETYLPGREFSVALLESLDSDELIAMPIELISEQNERGDSILGQEVKSADTEHIVLVTDKATKQAVVSLAKQAFMILGGRDYGRIDIRLDAQGVPHFLEANLIPGLAMHDFISYFTGACWINRAMDYESMVLHITELGIKRSIQNERIASEVIADISALVPAFKAALEAA